MGGLRDHAELAEIGLGGFSAIPAGTPISAAAIDAHAGVPGAGVGGTGTMVMVLGTSGYVFINFIFTWPPLPNAASGFRACVTTRCPAMPRGTRLRARVCASPP